MVKVRGVGINMTEGPLLKRLILYALPILGIEVIQILFNTADVAVLGIFASDAAVAGVGATASLTTLIVGLFVGISIGANVLVARCVGAKNEERARRLVGTSVALSVVFGLILMIIGVFLSETFLTWLGCEDELLDYATRYMRVYFLGIPIIMLYNFLAAILRAVGDTLRPFIFLTVGGVFNIVLNVFFIAVVGLDVEGVAIATVVSKGIAAALSLVVVIRGKNGYARLEWRHIKFYKREISELFRIGIPSGIQKSLFSLSNVVVTSKLIALGEEVYAGNTIAHQFDAIIYSISDSFATASLSFVSQNLGAKNFKRIWLVILETAILTSVIGFAFGLGTYALGEVLCGIMTDSLVVIGHAMTRLKIMGIFYFLTGVMNVFGNTLKGIGMPTLSMLSGFFSSVVFRIFWVSVVFSTPTLMQIYICYPLSWLLCIALCAGFAIPRILKLQREHARSLLQNKTEGVKENV